MKTRGPKLYKKLRRSGEIRDVDFKFLKEKPDGDVGFDPEHNRKVVEETIKKTDELIAKKKQEYLNAVEERVDAGVYFLKALSKGKYASSDPRTQALKYFGRRELARLRGEEIKRELMQKIGITSTMANMLI